MLPERGNVSGGNTQGLEAFVLSTKSSIPDLLGLLFQLHCKDVFWSPLIVLFFFFPSPCKVSEIQKLDGQVKELVLKSSVEAERLVAGKLKKDTYIENEKMHSNKRQDLVTKIDNILDAL